MRQENPAAYKEDASINARHFAHFARLAITPEPNSPGHFNFILSGKSGTIRLNDIDLLAFVPRVPAIAKGDRMLTDIAIQEHEYNRYDTAIAVPGKPGVTAHLANNCLNAGLWELYLTRRNPQGKHAVQFYHGWFNFPAGLYRRLFKRKNGLDYSKFSWLMNHFAPLEGLHVNLNDLRKVRAQHTIPLTEFKTHLNQPVLRLDEQRRKLKLVLTKGLRTYGDFAAPKNQPVKVTCFCPPGMYMYSHPKKFNYSFLGRISKVVVRKVSEPALHSNSDEIEVDFKRGTHWHLALSGGFPWIHWPPVRVTHGLKLVLGGIDFNKLPVITSDQPTSAELRHIFFGIGTPVVYAPYKVRMARAEQQPSAYLLLLDRNDRYVDNHSTTGDGVYLGRRPDGRIEIYMVSYEREAIVAHWTLPPAAVLTATRQAQRSNAANPGIGLRARGK